MKIIAFFLLLVLFYGCHSQAQIQGVIVVHNYFFGVDGPTAKPPLDIKFRVWFKGSQSIQEVPELIFSEDSSGSKASVIIKSHSYLDPDNNVCYNYASFSDTAKVLEWYSDMDSVVKKGGKNFYSNKRFEYDSSMNLSDTIVNGVNYGRIKLNKTVNGNKGHLIVYYRCDKKQLLIKTFKNVSDSIGCPIVRDDSYLNGKLFMIGEFEFVSDKLSESELKVFKAWEQNVGKYPVRKKS